MPQTMAMVSAPFSRAFMQSPRVILKGRQTNSGAYMAPLSRVLRFGRSGTTASTPMYSTRDLRGM